MKDVVTVIGSLPPIKGISQYMASWLELLEKESPVLFLGFKSIYPNALYPGGTKDSTQRSPKLMNTTVWNGITWYNPFSWLVASVKCTSVIEIHYWTPFLFPILFTIILVNKIRGNAVSMVVHNVLPHGNVSRIKVLLHKMIFFFVNDFIVHSEESESLIRGIRSKSNISIRKHPAIKVKMTTKNYEKKFYGISNEDKVYLFFGNIRPYKQLEKVITTFHKISTKEKGSKLVIAGQFWKGKSMYLGLISRLGLNNDVIILPRYIPDTEVSRLFKIADCLIIAKPEKTGYQSGVIVLAESFSLPILYCM